MTIKDLLNKPELVFLIISTFFGLLLVFFTPIFQVPDEPMHLLRACEVSNLVIHNDKTGDISKDILPFRKQLVKDNISCFQEFKTNKYYLNNSPELFEFENLNYTHNNTGYSFILYLPSAVTLKIAHCITHNPYIQFYLARMANLFIWILFIFCAIRITPVFKWQFLICALFPMTIYEGMSLSADSFNFGFLFLYIALIFNFIFSKEEKISRPLFYLFIFMSLISIFMKGAILFLLLFYFVPKDKLKNKNLIFLLLLVLCYFMQFVYSANSFVFIGNDVNMELRKLEIVSDPISFLILLIKTLKRFWLFYFKSSIFKLGWLDITPYSPTAYLLFLLYLSASLLEKVNVNWFLKIFSIILNMFFIFLTIAYLYLTFSPEGSNVILGIQGRYFIPLYLTFTLCTANTIFNLSDIHKYRLKIFIISILCITLCYALYLVYSA